MPEMAGGHGLNEDQPHRHQEDNGFPSFCARPDLGDQIHAAGSAVQDFSTFCDLFCDY
jgi:hypothetical protein